MKSFKIVTYIFTLSLFVFTSCHKDDSVTNGNGSQVYIPDSFSEYFGNEISRDFLGTVVDKNKLPIEGVTITIGNETVLTDSNGIFILRDADVNQRFGYVKAEKAGYIHGSRSVVPSEGTNKVKIMLLEANVIATINSGSSETVTLNNGSSVSFDGNFIKEDGSTYSGSVDVMVHHLDPANEDMSKQMPGMLYAQNSEGAERMLQTLGMLAVELRGSSGEDLNLAEGSTSEIKMSVDPSLMSIAPATIPLWYFDEAKGYWIEEGEATLQGNMYVGTVSHFSFWNCDIPTEAITLCINTIDEDGIPLANLSVSITSANFGTTYGYTNENGKVCGFVPSDETLELNIYNYDLCGDSPVYIETIGPFSVDTNTSAVVPDNPDIIQENVVGTFNNCNGDAVSQGYVQITYGNQTFIDIVEDGAFEINLLRCTDNNIFSIKAIDYVNLQTTDNINYTFTTPITTLGALSTCNSVSEFVQYTIDDSQGVLLTVDISAYFYVDNPNLPEHSFVMTAFSNIQGECFYTLGLLNNPDFLGTYNHLASDGSDGNNTGFTISSTACLSVSNENNNIIFNLTALGAVGEYIDINFNGLYEDEEGNPHTITGIVHVLRDN
ncbi:carboxypeptidase-like regulatory domain-containing protein [Winogradskyella forsetii]|uniref:carboxypeptidase-like regulatory domain-containing protein n=1 Tax=Winogradskyella forsetii TaxID=2686077 RepID=UPI0015B8E39E|nr:carboxypeptidase-like regulatory domain-containing protein [Winogradskyella forsetii]